MKNWKKKSEKQVIYLFAICQQNLGTSESQFREEINLIFTLGGGGGVNAYLPDKYGFNSHSKVCGFGVYGWQQQRHTEPDGLKGKEMTEKYVFTYLCSGTHCR